MSELKETSPIEHDALCRPDSRLTVARPLGLVTLSCDCDLIAKVRADERWERLERIIAAGEVAEAARREVRAEIADRLAEQERLSAAVLGRDGTAYNEGCRDAYDIAEQIARGSLA